jgi:hypothetical protein
MVDSRSDRDAGDRSSGAVAADVFTADLRPRPGGRVLHGARIAAAFASQLAMGLLPSPSVHDVVVTRRDDGSEVLREPAGDPTVAGDLLAQIRAELASTDPDSFLQEWSALTPPGR